jgi:hypothetical protein
MRKAKMNEKSTHDKYRIKKRALKKSAELSDYTDFDMITQIFQCNFICVIGIESL